MLKHTSSLVVLGVCGALLGGCEKSADERVQDTNEAREKAAENTREAVDEAQKKTAEARQEANEKIAEEQARVDKKVAENRKDIETVRTDVRKDLDDKLTKVDKDLIEIRSEIKSTADNKLKTPRVQLQQAADTLQAQLDATRRSVADVGTAAATSIEATKHDLSARIDQLSKSADDLKKRID